MAAVTAARLEVPPPLLLLRTATLNLAESVGFPIAAYAIGAWLGGRNAGLLAGLGAVCLTALIRRVVTGVVPGLVAISAIVLAIQTVTAIATGQLWVFLIHFPIANVALFALFAQTARGPDPLCSRLAAEMVGMRTHGTHQPRLHRFFQDVTWLWAVIFLVLAVLMFALLATQKTSTFLLLSFIATVVLIALGAAGSVVWLRWVLRRHHIRLCVAPPAGDVPDSAQN